MKTSNRICWIFLTLFSFAVIAQTTPSSPKKSETDSVVKAIRFEFVFTATASPNFQSTVATPSAYRADDSWQPSTNERYRAITTDKVSLDGSHQIGQVIATLHIKNEETKKIKSIVWEFTDPHFKGDKEIAFTEVKTKLKLAAGETGVLSKRVSSYWPCRTNLDRTGQGQPISRTCRRENPRTTNSYPAEARIKLVNFEDGTMWKM